MDVSHGENPHGDGLLLGEVSNLILWRYEDQTYARCNTPNPFIFFIYVNYDLYVS